MLSFYKAVTTHVGHVQTEPQRTASTVTTDDTRVATSVWVSKAGSPQTKAKRSTIISSADLHEETLIRSEISPLDSTTLYFNVNKRNDRRAKNWC